MLKILTKNKSYLIGFLAIFIIGFVFGYIIVTIMNNYSAESAKSFWQALLPV